MPDAKVVHTPLSGIERGAGIAGLVFAALMTASLVVFNTLPAPTEAVSLLDWYQAEFLPRIQFVGIYLAPFIGIAFLWFMAAIRERTSAKTDRFFDTVFLGSGILFIAMFFSGAASGASLVAGPKLGGDLAPTAESVRVARLMSYSFFNVYAARAAGVFTMVTSGILLRSRVFPRWIGIIGVLAALVLLLATSQFRGFIYLFPAWVALVSVTFLVVLRKAPGLMPGASE